MRYLYKTMMFASFSIFFDYNALFYGEAFEDTREYRQYPCYKYFYIHTKAWSMWDQTKSIAGRDTTFRKRKVLALEKVCQISGYLQKTCAL